MIGVASAIFGVVMASAATLERAGLPDGGGTQLGQRSGRGLVQIAADEPVTVTIPSVAGAPGAPIALNLKVPLDGVRFALFRDIAPGIKFSHGFRMKNAWIVSTQDLESLQIIVPPAFEGPLIFDALFHRSQAAVAGRGVVIVNVKPASPVTEAMRPETQHSPMRPVVGTLAGQERSVGAAPRPKGVPPEEEKEELERGSRLVDMGDIATARLIYQNLAIRGSASGARLLAETYDPSYLKEAAITGLQPDIDAARKWYKVAVDLGDSQAAARLSVLAQY